jgi:hypothetical protein
MDIVEELLHAAQALDAAEVTYAVCGGLAVTIHGRPRLTIDIDLIVPALEMPQAIDAAARAGFDLPTGWVALPEEGSGIRRLFRLTKAVDNEFLTLDLLEVDSQDNLLLADCERLELHGRLVPVLSKASLIRMKINSTRTKDRLDVELLSDESEP